MSETTRLLVVANRTAESDELLAAIKQHAERGAVHVTLLVPATWEVGDPHGGNESARRHMRGAANRIRGEGIDVECALGDPDPVAAVQQTWDPERFDAVLVSTLPSRVSKWLKIDLPHRVEHLTGGPVEHVIASSAR